MLRHLTLPRNASVILLVALDVAAVYGSYAGALLLRFDGNVPSGSWELFLRVTPVVAAGYVAGNFVFGVYHTAWKYGGIRDLFNLAFAVTLVTLIAFVVNLLDFAFDRKQFPVSVTLIGGGLVFLTMASTKLWPYLNSMQFAMVVPRNQHGRRVMIVGAGDVGQLVAREYLHNPQWAYKPVCFVDDDPRKIGVRIHGIPVVGDRHRIPDLVKKHRVDEIVLTMQAIPGRSFEELMSLCRRAKVSVNIVPSPEDVLSGKIDRAVTVRFRG